MAATFALIAGGPLRRALETGQFNTRPVAQADTPFGPSEPILLATEGDLEFYLVPRQLPGQPRRAPSNFNCRATLYALKDLGVTCVVSWSAAGAVTHDLSIGQAVVPDDVIDLTRTRAGTYFETSGLGLLRQFPVFCQPLQQLLADAIMELGLSCRLGGTAAVTEGPRLETPAEVRRLAGFGADLVTHQLIPEVFLARELQMCMAGGLYVVNYAETGSRHRPFITRDLFGGLTQASM
ncbi:hypothetical protein LCGC14_1694580, partial [marine sediment metagenome]